MPGSVFMFHLYGLDLTPICACDVAVVQRLCTDANYKALKTMKTFGLKMVYDLDDNMWAIPPYNPAFKFFRELEPGFRICAAECELITVSTEPLRVAVRNAIGKGCPPVEVVGNTIDLDWFAPVPERLRRPKNGRVVMGWAGTNTHTGDVAKVFALLPRLLERLPQLEMEFAGLPVPENIKNHPRVRQRDFVPVAEWPARWSSWQWDVSIAPLDENKFNNSKSCIKALEAAALGIPCVMSDVAPYRDFCTHSRTLRENLLCGGPLQWERKIEALVVDAGLRDSLGTEMRRVAKERYDVSNSVARWTELVEAL